MGKRVTVRLNEHGYRRFPDLPKAPNEPDIYCPDMSGMRRYIDRLEHEVVRLQEVRDEG